MNNSPASKFRSDDGGTAQPQRRIVINLVAVLVLIGLTIGIKVGTNASWLVVLAEMALAVGGLSLLLILLAHQVTEPTQRQRRQFSILLVLLAMLALAMFLAGVTGIFRLARFDPARMLPADWVQFTLVTALAVLVGVPLLMCLLDTLITAANAAIRNPAIRQLIRRSARSIAGPRMPTSDVVLDHDVTAKEESSTDIGSRPRGAGYIHGTDASEQARLELLNRLTNGPFLEFLNVQTAMRVLEVGSGLGILAAEVAAVADRVEVVGLERSSDQLSVAIQSPRVRYVQGDAHELPFADGSFDLVYCRYLLEHVADPQRVLKQMRRVTRAGGRVAAMENDISLVRLDPPCPTFEKVWSTFATYQRQLGGDGLIGRRLFRLFRETGFTQIELSVQPELHGHGSHGFAPWLDNLAGNITSGQQGLIGSGLCTAEQIRSALGELSALKNRDDASLTFVWNRAAAVR